MLWNFLYMKKPGFLKIFLIKLYLKAIKEILLYIN